MRSSTTPSTPTPGDCWARSRGSTSRARSELTQIAGQPPIAAESTDGLPVRRSLQVRLRQVHAATGFGGPLGDAAHLDRCWLTPAEKLASR